MTFLSLYDPPPPEKKRKKHTQTHAIEFNPREHFICQITAAVLLSSSADISDVKPCELKTALNYIHLDTSPADLCKDRAIEGASYFIMRLSIADIVLNGIFFFFALFAFAKTSFNSKVYTAVHCCVSNLIHFMNLSII